MALRVGLELTGLQLDATGSARLIIGLNEALRRRSDVDVVSLKHRSEASGLRRALARELLWFPWHLPRQAARHRLDVLHCPVPLAPQRSQVPVVLTVHDAMPVRHPEWFTRANTVHHRLVVRRAARAATLVCTPSEHARRDVADALGLDLERTAVVPSGVGPEFTPAEPSDEVLSRLGVRRPYLLAVGTLQPRKNIEGALRAFAALSDAGAPHQLVVAGARGWRDEQLVDLLRSPTAAGRVVATGHVSDADLVELYRGADCFVFPSRYEGFGLPPLEAMACGTPVVCSDRTSIPEVVGDAALLADPDDRTALADAICRALDPREAAELRARGRRRAAEYTWERTAEAAMAAYRRAAAVAA